MVFKWVLSRSWVLSPSACACAWLSFAAHLASASVAGDNTLQLRCCGNTSRKESNSQYASWQAPKIIHVNLIFHRCLWMQALQDGNDNYLRKNRDWLLSRVVWLSGASTVAWALVFRCVFVLRFVNDLGGGMVEFVIAGDSLSRTCFRENNLRCFVSHSSSVTFFCFNKRK